MKSLPKLGQQEMEILNWIGDHSPASVREAAENFPGLARTTVLTVMERLRKKGLLTRRQSDGVYQYAVKFDKSELLQMKVAEFVQRTLGGSLSPVLNYFFDRPSLSADELEQLKELVNKMEAKDGASR